MTGNPSKGGVVYLIAVPCERSVQYISLIPKKGGMVSVPLVPVKEAWPIRLSIPVN